MCGIAGCFNGAPRDTVKAMIDAIAHRGPDEEGVYCAPDRRAALGNRRLSIIDLGHGHQPMSNEDGSVWITYNGEIYNHRLLREELEKAGHQFSTNCDTEVLIHGWEQWGEKLVEKLNGNFAFALYDENKRVCFLARDRLGIRPLFYTSVGDQRYFASEIKSLLKVPGIDREIDPMALDQFLSLRYSFGERTMLSGIRRLPPGCTILLHGESRRIDRYWEPEYAPQHMNLQDATDRLDELLVDSVRSRLMSDVPLGMYLSGGVDSALILALMAKETSTPVKTYSVGFGLDLDETSAAKDIADEHGADHTEISLPRDSFLRLPEIVRMIDEPLGDMIIIPTYFLSREASKNVKVILTGEGADEVFGSYVHHYLLTWFEQYRRVCPKPLQRLNCAVFGMMPTALLEMAFPYPERMGKAGRARFMSFLRQAEDGNGYLPLVQLFTPEEKATLYSSASRERAEESWREAFDLSRGHGAMLNRLIRLDSRNWLPDYTLFKQDRLTMANSIEGRVPYLDHRLVEFVAGLPVGYKQKGFTAKYLLRRVADRHLVTTVAKRKKAAFYLPVRDFFGPEFHDFVRDTLNESAVAHAGLFDPKAVGALVDRGLRGELLASKRLMAVLIFTLWHQTYIDNH